MVHSGNPPEYWPHALQYAAELENRCMPMSSTVDHSAYYAFYGVHPDNDLIQTFGCQAWLWKDRERRVDQRWDDTAISCAFLGFTYHYGKKGWLLLSLGDNPRYHVSTNVTFNNGILPFQGFHARAKALAQVWGENPTSAKPTIIDLNQFLSHPSHDPTGTGPVRMVVDGEVVDIERPKKEGQDSDLRPGEIPDQGGLGVSLPYGIPQPVQATPWLLPPGVYPNQLYAVTKSNDGENITAQDMDQELGSKRGQDNCADANLKASRKPKGCRTPMLGWRRSPRR